MFLRIRQIQCNLPGMHAIGETGLQRCIHLPSRHGAGKVTRAIVEYSGALLSLLCLMYLLLEEAG